MDNPPWLDRVRKQLARHDLPPSYVQRFVEELGDHLKDLEEEGMEADASSRLGEPEQVTNAAVAAYRRRSFLGRHPLAVFLVFAISPVVPQYFLFLIGATVLIAFRTDHTLDWYENRWILSLMIAVCSTFLSMVYGELAMRLGIGRKWTLASCAVLGVLGMLLEFGLRLPVMALGQFAAPLAVGWWFTKRKCNRGCPATTFLVFAISPVAYIFLWPLVALAFVTGLSFLNLYVGLAAVYAVPTVVASLLYCRLAKRLGSGRRWMFALCLVLATLIATPIAPLLLICVVPTVVASLLYCKLAKRLGSGEKCMFLSCLMLATFGAMQSLQILLAGYETTEGHRRLPIALTMCIILAQILIPLAIGWWFMRRKHDQGQLELAS